MLFEALPFITFNYRGTWNSGTTYNAGDAIRSDSNGFLYVATAAITGNPSNADPGSSTPPPNPWAFGTSQAIPRGETGLTGATGEPGDSIVGYFRESPTRPGLVGDSYVSGTFTPPTGWSQTIPSNPTNPVYLTVFRLDGDGTNYENLGIIRITGIRGETGRDGVGIRGETGQDGNDGRDGTDGINGSSSQIIFRKSLSFELTDRPTVTFNGTSLSLPIDDNRAWSEQPYVSKVQGHWSLAGIGNNAPDHANINPESIEIDDGVQPNIIYVLDSNNHGDTTVGGYVYKYSASGQYMSRFALHADNDTAIDLDVRGSYVRVLDGRTRGSQQVFVYNKSDGGRQTAREFMVPDASVPEADCISTHSNSIYLTSINSIRRFDISTNVEQSTGGLSGLTQSPVGTDINDYYFFIADGSQNKVFVRDINTLSLRHTIREWDIGNSNEKGIAVGEFEVLILDISARNVYRYYNPDNILWGSVVFYSNEGPSYTVSTTKPFDMTGQRGSGSGVVIQGTGTGMDGNSVRLIFQEVGTNDPAPSTPTANEGHYSDGNYITPPANWHLTASEAEAAFSGSGNLYMSVVYLSGNGNTILRYETPVDITGPEGPAGTAAAAGNSVEFIYRTAATRPPVPTGGTFIAATRTFTAPADWTLSPPTVVPNDENLYFTEAVLPGQGTDGGGTITYRNPGILPRGAQGRSGNTGPEGAPSTVPGPAGDSFRMIFREATATPTAPTGGSLANNIF